MQPVYAVGYIASRTASVACVLLSLFLGASSAFGQQEYVGRYDAYGGYTYLDSRVINLVERGFQTQVGMRLNHWVSVGFDYNIATGTTTLTPALVRTSVQGQLAEILAQLAAAGLVPPGYSLAVPLNSQTQTFAAGTQFAYRRLKLVTLFVRPDLGAIRELATPRPHDPVTAIIVGQLTPSGTKLDWTPFYGIGGGFELNVTKHCTLRFQADFVHDHLFNDLLNGRNTVRFSVGPGFQWGRNVAE